ncbi:PorT family protein [Hymenobacter lutimineralis]|uniref:PorT family protein n=1 Tax=Hymenobacter lutimineralis TaxID=2606448 RepID=A0A5D6UUY7_9BACT|nr:porin family protein [Hymenobacter lutimineralis]TYZ06254.1 PorT family protein [Hymenobacter lutimineralis]
MKRLLLLNLFCGLLNPVFAQSGPGLKVGATYTRYAGPNTNNLDYQVGVQGGLTYNLRLSQEGFFSLQPELLYTQKGARVTEDGRRYSSRLHYLDVPILARINTAGFVVEAGPQIGFLLKQTGNYSGQAPTYAYRKLDLGYVAGLGYQAQQGYVAGVRYNGGLADIFDMLAGGTVNPHNNGFQAYLGYVFGQK